MRDAYPQFQILGIDVGAVTFGNPETTDRFCMHHDAPFACFADPARRAYDAFGLSCNPSVFTLAHPRGWPAFFRAVRRGRKPFKGRLSVRQMPGAFLIDSAGELRYEHRNRYPADNPPLEELLAAAAATSRA